MSVKINIEKAEINTATVEIKTLMVNSRKLTLSVFRQIFEEPLIDIKSLTLNGIPWGIVNYYWGDMCKKHIHIVWQSGKELRRALVDSEKSSSDIDYKYSSNIYLCNTLINIFNKNRNSENKFNEYNERFKGYWENEFDRLLSELVTEYEFKDRIANESTYDVCIRAQELRNNSIKLADSRAVKYKDIISCLESLPHLMIAI